MQEMSGPIVRRSHPPNVIAADSDVGFLLAYCEALMRLAWRSYEPNALESSLFELGLEQLADFVYLGMAAELFL